MSRVYCEHGYPKEKDNLDFPLCPTCRALERVYGDQREQRRYEIARDVMAARAAAYALAFRFERSSEFKANAAEAVEAADALLAALEEE